MKFNAQKDSSSAPSPTWSDGGLEENCYGSEEAYSCQAKGLHQDGVDYTEVKRTQSISEVGV